MSEEIVYSKEILKLLNIDGFSEKWVSLLHKYPSNKAAYEAVEEIHLKYFGKRKYKNYNTFRVMFDRKNIT